MIILLKYCIIIKTYLIKPQGEVRYIKAIVKKIFSENNDFQRVEVIKRNREKRNKHNEFWVDGVKSINYAIENNWNIKSYDHINFY